MECPTCKYVMSPFDKECPRCAWLKANPKAPEPTVQMPPPVVLSPTMSLQQRPLPVRLAIGAFLFLIAGLIIFGGDLLAVIPGSDGQARQSAHDALREHVHSPDLVFRAEHTESYRRINDTGDGLQVIGIAENPTLPSRPRYLYKVFEAKYGWEWTVKWCDVNPL